MRMRGQPLVRAARARLQIVRSTSTSVTSSTPQRSLLEGPPREYDHRAATRAATLEVVSRSYPQLLDLVNEGVLFVHRRPHDYVERREDGYVEPRLVFVVGTAHISRRSAADVDRVIRAVQPNSVVVELCKSRSGIMFDPPADPQTSQGQGEVPARPPATEQAAAPAPGKDPHQGQDAASSRAQGSSGSDSGSDGSSSSSGSSGRDTGSEEAAGAGRHNSHDRSLPVSTSAALSVKTPAPAPAVATAATATAPPPSTARRNSSPLAMGDAGEGLLQSLARAARLGGQSGLVLRLLLNAIYTRATGSLNVVGGEDFRAAAGAAEATGAQLVLGDRPVEVTLSRAWAALTWQRQVVLARDMLIGAAFSPTLTDQMLEDMKQDDALSALMQQMQSTYPELVQPFVTERDLYLAWSLKRSKAVKGNMRVVGVVGKGHLRGIAYALEHDSGALRFKDLVARGDGKGKEKAGRDAVARRRQPAAVASEVALTGVLYMVLQAISAGGAG